jgi:outer membrane biosynthesis protein TonB
LEGDKKNQPDNQVGNSQMNIVTTDYVIDASGRKVYKMAEAMPEFPGGDKELVSFLKNNLRYPNDAKENGIQGTVVTQFTVDIDGSISDIAIKNSLSKKL